MKKTLIVVSVIMFAWMGLTAWADCPPPASENNPLAKNLGKLFCGEAYKVEFIPDDPNDAGVFEVEAAHVLPVGVVLNGLVLTIVPDDVGSVILVLDVIYTAEVGSYTVAQQIEYRVIKIGGGYHLNFSKD
jgi:hypothetical protein